MAPFLFGNINVYVKILTIILSYGEKAKILTQILH